MKASDIMTVNPVAVQPETSVAEAVRLMLQHKFSGLPVVDVGGAVIGIVTEGDLLRRSETDTQRRRGHFLEFLLGPGRLALEYTHLHGRKVDEIMTRPVHTISEETPLVDVVKAMEQHHVKRLPVVRNGRLVEIISRANLLHALASVIAETKPTSRSDADIRSQMSSAMAGQSWAPAALVDVVVRNGVIHLWGTILDERQRQALRVLAENTPGMKSVEDHLVWVDPMTGTVIPPVQETGSA